MKSRIVLFLILIVAIACNNNASHSKHLHFVNVYENALMHGDVNVAVNACYEIIANDSTKTNYYDTLVYLYLNTQNQGATFLAARSSLKYTPNNDKMTKVAAEYAKKLGMLDTAIVYYKRTFVINNKLENLYDVAQAQYNMENDAGAEQTVDMIIKSENSEKEKIYIATENQESQMISIKAAALNIKGLIAIQLGLKDNAINYFDEALKIEPSFKLANNNKSNILSGKVKFKK